MWEKKICILFQVPFPLYFRPLSREVSTCCWTGSTQTHQHLRVWREIQLKTDCQYFSLSYSFCNLYSAFKYEAYFHPSQKQIAHCDHFQPARITALPFTVIQNGMRTRHAVLICKRNRRGAPWKDPPFLLVLCSAASSAQQFAAAQSLHIYQAVCTDAENGFKEVQRADESCWAHPCSYVFGAEKPRVRRDATIKNGIQSFPVKRHWTHETRTKSAYPLLFAGIKRWP